MLLIVNTLLGLVILALVSFLRISSTSVSVAGIIAATIVGQIYAMNFREVMPKRVRVYVAIIYTLTQLIVGLLYAAAVKIQWNVLFGGIMIGLNLLYSVLVYWMPGFGANSYLRALK